MRLFHCALVGIMSLLLASASVRGDWQINDVDDQSYPIVTIPYSGTGPVNSNNYLFQDKSDGSGNWETYGFTLMTETSPTNRIATSTEGWLWSTTGYKDSMGGSYAVGHYNIYIIQEGADAHEFFYVN